MSEEGEIETFRNRWIRQTKTLYFCRYDFETQTMYPKYRATKTSSKKTFPTEPVENNFFYQVYRDLRINNGIRNFVFIIPGHAKTFKKQLEDYMLRLKQEYADSLKNTAFITFAWSSESIGPLYYRGQRAADASSNDFAIFQHMLESFMADTAFWQAHPRDLSIKLVCTSMGNELLRRYLIKRKMQGIPLVQVYDRIILIGSDAPADAFQKGKGFDNMLELTESMLILVNRRDGPLTLSQYMNLEGRMGKSGPVTWTRLPEEIVVRDVTNLIAWEDLPALGHDYFLRNTLLMNYILHQQLSDELPSDFYELVD
jgi:esterase/lipase superfamily enzyme